MSPIVRRPDLVVAEVANVIWKKALRGQVGEAQARFGCAALARYFDVLHASEALIESAIALAVTLRHPIYDCLYLACAERARAPLVTADRRLLAVVRDSRLAARVVPLDGYGRGTR